MSPSSPFLLTAKRSDALKGSFPVPGDKSISHRALLLGAVAVGSTKIEGLLESADVLNTARAVAALGAEVERLGPGSWQVAGRGVSGLEEPEDCLDLGNSGTSARLLLGLLAQQPITAFLTGDASLRSRPMSRVIQPLTQMGLRFVARMGGRLPLSVKAPERLLPLEYRLPVPSAQVKSALLLAGLAAPGATCILEPEATRDHSERMLRAFGAEVREEAVEGERRIVLRGEAELTATTVAVPADPSSAAFPTVAALLVPGSELLLPGICSNPLRSGLYRSLEEMGADLVYENRRDQAGEPVADLRVRASRLRAIRVPAARAPSMIDEYPILAMAAALAEGRSLFEGLKELRVKESDRLAALAQGLAACGVEVESGEDWLAISGSGGPPRGGVTVQTRLDHRIAMSFLVLGLTSTQPIGVDDGHPIATSFPGFVDSMRAVGARIEEEPTERETQP